jgi:RimJ/RimL family protein N-acetyltransferase
MDYTTPELVNAFKSDRLEYVKADKLDTNLQKFVPLILQDPVILAMNSPGMLLPTGQKEVDSYIQSVADSLLGVAICLKDEPSTTSEQESNGDTEKTPTIIGIMCIGWGGISPSTAHHRNAEIGICLAKPHQGKGYGREAINWVLDWGFRHAGLHSIGISTASYNSRAEYLYQSIGFKFEGKRRDTIWQNRGWHDLVMFGMTEYEWESLRGIASSSHTQNSE